MIYYHFNLVPNKPKAIQACNTLKSIGEDCEAPELVELAEEKKTQIMAIPDAEFVPHPNDQLAALMALAPEGAPFMAIALTLRKYQKEPEK